MEVYQSIPSPCFVLEENKLLQNLEVFKTISKETGVKILLALKGFASYSCFPLVREYLEGATASSLNEALLIKYEMEDKAHTCAVVYLENEVNELFEISSHLTFNSLNQFEKYKSKLTNEHKVALRVNPGYSPVEIEIYNPCDKGTRLGVRDLNILPKGISGLHFHALCENNSYEFEKVLENFKLNFGHLLDNLEWINFGGGHLMTHKEYDLEHFKYLISEFKKDFKGDIFIEPGSAIGWQVGFLKTTVLDIVEDLGIRTAILDVSFSNHMPDCLEMPYKPKVTGEVDGGKYSYRFGGCTCLAGDFIDGFTFDKELKIGDQIIFEDMAHYTTVKTTTFNGINLPNIGTIGLDGNFELNKTFGYEEYKSRL